MNQDQKHIGVVYFTQTGQLKHLVERVLSVFPDNYKVDYLRIVPEHSFPFPWSSWKFFDAMPECVLEDGMEVEVEGIITGKRYDLLIVAFQPWFLHPSLPMTSFMQNEIAESLISGTKILTLIGARNMWLNAQEKIKKHIIRLGGHLVGNIAFVDSSPNLVSTLTVIRWAFKGQKEASKFLPEAGIQQKEIDRAPDFGKSILKAFESDDWEGLQNELVNKGAIDIKPALILLEETGTKQFKIWAKKIKSKGAPGSLERKPIVLLFKNILIVGIFIVSPIKGLVSKFQAILKRRRLESDLIYYKSVDYIDNKF